MKKLKAVRREDGATFVWTPELAQMTGYAEVMIDVPDTLPPVPEPEPDEAEALREELDAAKARIAELVAALAEKAKKKPTKSE